MARPSLPVGGLQSIEPSLTTSVPRKGVAVICIVPRRWRAYPFGQKCLAADLWSTPVKLVKSRTMIGIITMDVRRNW